MRAYRGPLACPRIRVHLWRIVQPVSRIGKGPMQRRKILLPWIAILIEAGISLGRALGQGRGSGQDCDKQEIFADCHSIAPWD